MDLTGIIETCIICATILVIMAGVAWAIWYTSTESYVLPKAKNRQAVDDYWKNQKEKQAQLAGKS